MAIVVVDASVVIAHFDGDDAHHAAAAVALREADADELVVPASAYAEVLVRPYRRGARSVAQADEFFAEIGARIEPIGTPIAKRAAYLRSSHTGLRLPDALVLATGDLLDADRVLTTDRALARFSRRVRPI